MSDFVVDGVLVPLAEELAQQLGLTVPSSQMAKCAGSFISTEALKAGLDLIVPTASSAVGFSTTGITLALIQRKLREIQKNLSLILDSSRKIAKDRVTDALTALENENFLDAYEEFKKAGEKASEGFHTSQNNEARITCTKIKLFSQLMTKCYDRENNIFIPFSKLSAQRKREVATLLRGTIDNLLDEIKATKSTFDLVDTITLKSKVKKTMMQSKLNEVFCSAYKFLSEGLNWTSPGETVDERSDVIQIKIFPQYIPVGQEDAIELVVGIASKSLSPITISMYRRSSSDKVGSKLVVQKVEFSITETFDNTLMIEVFASRVAVFHSDEALLRSAARIGRDQLIASILERNSQVDINAKNYRGESALILATANGHLSTVQLLLDMPEVNANICDVKGNTPLHVASSKGNCDIILALLQNCDVDVLNDEGASPLSNAAENGHVQALELLMRNRAQINSPRQSDGCTPLFLAAMNNHAPVVKMLIQSKCDAMMTRWTDEATPFWISAHNGHLDVLKILTKSLKKKQMRTPTKDNITPAQIASQNGHILAYMFLKKNGAI